IDTRNRIVCPTRFTSHPHGSYPLYSPLRCTKRPMHSLHVILAMTRRLSWGGVVSILSSTFIPLELFYFPHSSYSPGLRFCSGMLNRYRSNLLPCATHAATWSG